MRRRTLLAAALMVPAASAQADDRGGGEPAVVNIPGVGLPVIADGRLRNYVFVSLRLHLAPGRSPDLVRHKDAFFRDALVKAAHRTPFTVPGTWTQLNAAAMSAALLRAAPGICGAGVVSRVEILNQAARRQLRAG
jgi:hypothetical protein